MAAYWYERATNHGSAASPNNLGLLYLTGKGVLFDLDKAEKLLLLSHSRGDHKACSNLSELYFRKQDPERALMWHERALAKGVMYSQRDDKEFRENIRKLEEKFEKTETRKWEREQGLDHNNMSHMDRHKRYMNKHGGVSHSLLENFDALRKVASSQMMPDEISSTFRFKPQTLVEYAQKGSATAKKMLNAQAHFFTSLEMVMSDQVVDEQEFIKHFGNAYRIEPLVVCIPMDLQSKFLDLVNKVLKKASKEPSEMEENARICYAGMQGGAGQPTIDFLTASLKRFPNSITLRGLRGCLYSFAQQHEDSLRDHNAALDIDPNDIETLYVRAATLRLIQGQERKSIEAYQKFLSLAPKDHRKVPESCYAMAMCHLVQGRSKQLHPKVRELFDQGLALEKDQLPFFLPYDSNNKKLLEMVFHTSNPPTNIIPPPQTSPPRDAVYLSLIKNFRHYNHGLKQMAMHSQHLVKASTKPPKQQKLPRSLAGLKKAYLKDLDTSKDQVWEGFVITLINVDLPCTGGPSLMMTVEDENRDLQRLSIYNLGDDYESLEQTYGIGCTFDVLNPYMRLAADGSPIIRVDDPRTVIISDEKRVDVCRCCGKANSTFSCAKCGGRYCSKECQAYDWKTMDHKKVCSMGNNNLKPKK
eukprot:TRINITY_DN3795_c0_g1_i4.p1 TRINITY_DN3795_c0_g1~~TRINITY_DN3795_c0_g1_i4.p1  ORF type:complete len:643 (-),score=126.93 TRINITY_DN3795_c0_g1_i4:101-2029(-)